MQEYIFTYLEIFFVILLIVFITLQITLEKSHTRKQARNISELKELLTVDHLTGLLNRKAIDEGLIRLLGTEPVTRINDRRSHDVLPFEPVSLMMIDSDRFKQINDKYGHPTGDRVLQMIAIAIKLVVHRNTDMVGRMGGDEFVVVLVNTSLKDATVVAEKLREAVLTIDFSLEKGIPDDFRTTVSIGLACADCWNDGLPYSLMKSADNALYKAKETGGNKVYIAVEEESSL
ncbi:MAG: two-component system chemotaxis family response regulator WspR [Candidatus Paceibacteria bacterium]|jgi:two-component system chemotaxis family response regulator WspR